MPCPTCADTGWTCEAHPDRPWGDNPFACKCGALAMPCELCNSAGAIDKPSANLPTAEARPVDLDRVVFGGILQWGAIITAVAVTILALMYWRTLFLLVMGFVLLIFAIFDMPHGARQLLPPQ
jgi:hypothetical protein